MVTRVVVASCLLQTQALAAQTAQPLDQTFVSAPAGLTIQDRFTATVGVCLTRELAGMLTARMLMSEVNRMNDDDWVSVAGELSNLIRGRLNAQLAGRALRSTLGLPSMEVASQHSPPSPGHGFAPLSLIVHIDARGIQLHRSVAD